MAKGRDLMMNWRLALLAPLLGLALALGAGCGDGDDDGNGDGANGEGEVEGEMTLRIETPEDSIYDRDELRAPPGTEVTIEYLNDTPIIHNIHVFEGEEPDGTLARTELETGPDNLQTVTFTTPEEEGRYFYHCDAHPIQMTGFLVIEEGAGN